MGTGGDESRVRQLAVAAALWLALLAGLPVAYAADPLYSADQVERDLEFLRRTVREVHPALASDEASAAFDMRVNQLLDRLDGPMTRMDVALAATQVVLCLPEPDAHTTVDYPLTGPVLPVRLRWVSDGLVVVQALLGSHSALTTSS